MKALPFNYHLSDSELQVRIGKWGVRRVRFDDIASFQEGSAVWNEHWTNVWPWRHVTIRRKTGFIKNFVITADDPEKFIERLRMKVLGGEGPGDGHEEENA